MKKDKLYIFIGLVLFFGFMFFRTYNSQLDIKKNEVTTTGKIIELFGKYQSRYGLLYEYYVNGKKYEGSVGITPFDCENGKKACVGSEFTVYYSSKNPENSRIDLGKYEKYKTTVEFVK